MKSEYKVENDEYYIKHISKPSINENTAKKYKKALTKFCRATGKTLSEIITDCIDEQNTVTTIELDPDEHGNKRRKEIRCDVNNKDAKINIYLHQHIDYCKNRKNKNITINRELGDIKAFLKGNGVILPKIEQLEDDSAEWTLLTKEDFNYILQDTTLVHLSLANFLTSTGMRIGDALSLTIGDFMKATSDYHDFVNVEDFIDNAPDDMIGTWAFEPNKTKKDKIKCITFNTNHASNLILQNLRHIKNQYLPYKNKKDKTDLKISKKDALFGSRTTAYKKPIAGKTVAGQWNRKSKKFQAWKINQIKQKIKNGELSEEDYDEEVARIPKFHPHICRKFFITTVGNNCGDIRVCALLEGHSGGLPTDKSYVKKNIEDIKEIYLNNIHDELCLSKVETKIVSDKETERLNAEIEFLKAENAKIREEKDQEISNLEQKHQNEIDELKSSVGSMQKQIDNLTSVRKRSNIEKTIYDFFKDNYQEDLLKNEENSTQALKKGYTLCRIAYDLAIEEEYNFRNDEDYLDSLIKKALVKYSLNPDLMIADQKELINIEELETLNKDSMLFLDLFKLIKSNDTLWNMVKDDQIKLKNIIVYVIKKNHDKIDNLTDEDKDNMVQEVLMEYLTVD